MTAYPSITKNLFDRMHQAIEDPASFRQELEAELRPLVHQITEYFDTKTSTAESAAMVTQVLTMLDGARAIALGESLCADIVEKVIRNEAHAAARWSHLKALLEDSHFAGFFTDSIAKVFFAAATEVLSHDKLPILDTPLIRDFVRVSAARTMASADAWITIESQAGERLLEAIALHGEPWHSLVQAPLFASASHRSQYYRMFEAAAKD